MPGGPRPRRPPKIEDVLPRVRACLERGAYRDTRHARERKDERGITLLEVQQVLRSGFREPSKDEYKERWSAWNYAIRGKTIDGRWLRVAVSLDPQGYALFITAIDLSE